MKANDNQSPPNPAADAAEAFLQARNVTARSASSRPVLLARCARHLHDNWDVSLAEGRRLAKAAAEVLERRQDGMFFDAPGDGRSVDLVDPMGGRRWTLTPVATARVLQLAARAMRSDYAVSSEPLTLTR